MPTYTPTWPSLELPEGCGCCDETEPETCEGFVLPDTFPVTIPGTMPSGLEGFGGVGTAVLISTFAGGGHYEVCRPLDGGGAASFGVTLNCSLGSGWFPVSYSPPMGGSVWFRDSTGVVARDSCEVPPDDFDIDWTIRTEIDHFDLNPP